MLFGFFASVTLLLHSDNPRKFTAQAMQYEMLQQFFLIGVLDRQWTEPMQTALMEYKDPSKATDVCAWNGITCSRGTVENMRLFSRANFYWVVSIDWLPPTLRYAHFDEIQTFDGWQPERLPRCLRYLYLSYNAFCANGIQRTVNLRHLPPEMEELILFRAHNQWLHGYIDISRLPSSMHILWMDVQHINSVFVDSAEALEKYRYFWVGCGATPAKMYEASGKRITEGMNRQNEAGNMTTASYYFHRFHESYPILSREEANIVKERTAAIIKEIQEM